MDPAQPDKNVLFAIYGENPHCFLGSGPAHEWHHPIGRGNDFGFKLDTPGREMFSSPYAVAPLGRGPHSYCPILKDRNMQLALLKHAKKMVDHAVVRGNYVLTANDRAFLELVNARLSNG